MALTPEQEKKFRFRRRLELEKAAMDEPSKLEAFTRGGAQGLTFGFSDEATGMAQAVKDYLLNKFEPGEGFGESYRKHRDVSRGAYEEAREAHPVTYATGDIAGAVAPAVAATILSGGTAAPVAGARLAPSLAKIGATYAPRTVKGLTAVAGLEGLGRSEADITKGDVGGAARDVAVGGTLGATIGKVAPVVGEKVVKPVARAMTKATGWGGKKALSSMFGPSSEAIETYLQKPGAIRGAKSFEELASDAPRLIEELDTQIRKYSDEALETLQDTAGKYNPIDLSNYVRSLQAKMEIQGVVPSKGAVKQAHDRLESLARFIDEIGEKRIYTPDSSVVMGAAGKPKMMITHSGLSERDMKKLIQHFDPDINWDKVEMGPQNQALTAVRGYIDDLLKTNTAYQNAMEPLSGRMAIRNELVKRLGLRKEMGGTLVPGDVTASKFKGMAGEGRQQTKALAGKLKEFTGRDIVQEAEESAVAGQFEGGLMRGGRNVYQWGAMGTGAGFGVGGPMGGMILGPAGAAFGAHIDKEGGRYAKKVLDWWLKHQPHNFIRFLEGQPTRFGQYTPILKRALQRGGQEFATTHYLLQQKDRNYSKMIEDIGEEEVPWTPPQ